MSTLKVFRSYRIVFLLTAGQFWKGGRMKWTEELGFCGLSLFMTDVWYVFIKMKKILTFANAINLYPSKIFLAREVAQLYSTVVIVTLYCLL